MSSSVVYIYFLLVDSGRLGRRKSHTHTQTYTHTYTQTYTHTHTHTYTHKHTHKHTYTHNVSGQYDSGYVPLPCPQKSKVQSGPRCRSARSGTTTRSERGSGPTWNLNPSPVPRVSRVPL